MNLILGSITNYNFQDIELWIRSLKSTSYKDAIGLVCFNIHKDTIEQIKSFGIIPILTEVDSQGNAVYNKSNWNICVDRFLIYHHYLSTKKYDRILVTDVKDIIFQRNPFEDVFEYPIRLSSEYLTYENEEWGKNNITQAFGKHFFEVLKDTAIMNAGVIEGSADYMRDLFLQIYMYCRGSEKYILGGGGPDQAALNIIVNTLPWKNISQTANLNFACQIGTTGDPNKIEKFKPYLLSPEPKIMNDMIYTHSNELYAIVHQYDRNPIMKQLIERKYRVTS